LAFAVCATIAHAAICAGYHAVCGSFWTHTLVVAGLFTFAQYAVPPKTKRFGLGDGRVNVWPCLAIY
jgi:hypothetical protein